jgi:hypothetical protein
MLPTPNAGKVVSTTFSHEILGDIGVDLLTTISIFC